MSDNDQRRPWRHMTPENERLMQEITAPRGDVVVQVTGGSHDLSRLRAALSARYEQPSVKNDLLSIAMFLRTHPGITVLDMMEALRHVQSQLQGAGELSRSGLWLPANA